MERLAAIKDVLKAHGDADLDGAIASLTKSLKSRQSTAADAAAIVERKFPLAQTVQPDRERLASAIRTLSLTGFDRFRAHREMEDAKNFSESLGYVWHKTESLADLSALSAHLDAYTNDDEKRMSTLLTERDDKNLTLTLAAMDAGFPEDISTDWVSTSSSDLARRISDWLETSFGDGSRFGKLEHLKKLRAIASDALDDPLSLLDSEMGAAVPLTASSVVSVFRNAAEAGAALSALPPADQDLLLVNAVPG